MKLFSLVLLSASIYFIQTPAFARSSHDTGGAGRGAKPGGTRTFLTSFQDEGPKTGEKAFSSLEKTFNAGKAKQADMKDFGEGNVVGTKCVRKNLETGAITVFPSALLSVFKDGKRTGLVINTNAKADAFANKEVHAQLRTQVEAQQAKDREEVKDLGPNFANYGIIAFERPGGVLQDDSLLFERRFTCDLARVGGGGARILGGCYRTYEIRPTGNADDPYVIKMTEHYVRPRQTPVVSSVGYCH